jgi:hypothetical protein
MAAGRATLLPLAALLAACAAEPPAMPELQARPSAFELFASTRGAWQGNAPDLEGEDPPEPSRLVQRGDRQLFALDLHDENVHEQWLLLLEALGSDPGSPDNVLCRATSDGGTVGYAFMSIGVDVRVRLFGPCTEDAAVPAQPRETTVNLFTGFLSLGFDRTCEKVVSLGLTREQLAPIDSSRRRPRRYQTEGIDPLWQAHIDAGFLTCDSFMSITAQSDVLLDLLTRIVKGPSLVSVLLHGVTLAASPGFERAVRTQDGWTFPIRMLVNGEAALDLQAFVVPAQRPRQLSAGIVALEARHPTNPARRMSARLLAARLGEQRQ